MWRRCFFSEKLRRREVLRWSRRSKHSVQVNEVGFRALTNCSDSTAVRVEMFKKYQVHKDQLEECPRAN